MSYGWKTALILVLIQRQVMIPVAFANETAIHVIPTPTSHQTTIINSDSKTKEAAAAPQSCTFNKQKGLVLFLVLLFAAMSTVMISNLNNPTCPSYASVPLEPNQLSLIHRIYNVLKKSEPPRGFLPRLPTNHEFSCESEFFDPKPKFYIQAFTDDPDNKMEDSWCTFPKFQGMSTQECLSILRYTSTHYRKLNQYLRGSKNSNGYWAFEASLNSALQKLPSYAGWVTRVESKLSPEEARKIYKAGEILKYPSFLSTSKQAIWEKVVIAENNNGSASFNLRDTSLNGIPVHELKVGHKFEINGKEWMVKKIKSSKIVPLCVGTIEDCSESFGGEVYVSILSKTGKNISSASLIPSEQEILFSSGSSFQVEKVEETMDTNSQKVIHIIMKEIEGNIAEVEFHP